MLNDEEVETEGGNGIDGRGVDRVGNVAGQVGSDGPAEQGEACSGDQVDAGVLRFGEPPGETGREDQKRRNQRRPGDP